MMLTHETLIPLAVFLAITLGAWVAAGHGRRPAARRPRTGCGGCSTAARPGASRPAWPSGRRLFQAKVTAAASKLGQSLRPSDEQELGKIRLKLLNAGFRQEQAVAVFYGIKLIGLLDRPGRGRSRLLSCTPGMTQSTYIVTACAAALGFYLPDFVVGHSKKKRGESIFLGLPDALDLMVVCVEAGLGLDAAMRRVTSELASRARCSARSSPSPTSSSRWAGRARTCSATWASAPASTTCGRSPP